MASEEGNNGNKRKHEEDEKGSAKKIIINVSDPTTSSGTAQDKQGPAEKNWVKFLRETTHEIPICKLCEIKYPLYIDSRPFEEHLNNEHSNKLIEKDTKNWIFAYFKPIKQTHYLECWTEDKCKYIREVQFVGPFVAHFDQKHKPDGILDGPSLESYKDKEEEIQKRMSKFVHHLFCIYEERQRNALSNEKIQEHTKQITWWREYVYWNIDTNKTGDTDQMRDTVICKICSQPFHVSIQPSSYLKHINVYHNKEKEEAKHMWLTKYFTFVNNIIYCTLCAESFYLYLKDRDLESHLKEEHHLDHLSGNNENENEIKNCAKEFLIEQFIRNLIKNHEYEESKKIKMVMDQPKL